MRERNCNGCKHVRATHGFGSRIFNERRAFVMCELFGKVMLSKHWQQGEEQPEAEFPCGCPRTQRALALDR